MEGTLSEAVNDVHITLIHNKGLKNLPMKLYTSELNK